MNWEVKTMQSATSYFNPALYRKTLARFWPLWTGYGVIWLFGVPLNMLSAYFDRYMSSEPQRRLLIRALNLPEAATSGLYLAAFFAILCAMAVFGYLYNSRSACWFHALPLRREALFTTQYLAGLSMLLLPQLAVAALTAVVEMSFLPMANWGETLSALLIWLLAQSGVCLFFFSFAAFCAMFTGHILALPAFYCILNVLASVLYGLVDSLFHEFFYGYAGSERALALAEHLTPVYALKDALVVFGGYEEGQFYRSPGTVAAYAAVGAALFFVSLYVYRRRHVETAGDVVSVPLVRPLFKYGVALCAGLSLGMLSTVFFFGWGGMAVLIPFILVWTVVGCFAAEMLLKKSFRVFKAWKGAAVMAAIMLALCLGCTLDLFGVETRVPAPERVKSVQVDITMGYPLDSGRSLRRQLTDPAQIEKVLALHQAIVDHREEDGNIYNSSDDYASAYLTYLLSDGSTLQRSYGSLALRADELERPGTVAYALSQITQDRALVAMAYDFDGFLEDYRLTGAWLDRVLDDQGEVYYSSLYVDDYRQQLWDAVQADFAEGTIGVRHLFDMDAQRRTNTYRTDLTFAVSPYLNPDPDGEVSASPVSPGGYDVSSTLSITLTPQAKHTLAVLDKTGLWEEGYSLAPWDAGEGSGGRVPHTSAW